MTLTDISEGLGGGLSGLQWIVTGYMKSGPTASRFTDEDGKLKTEHKFMSDKTLSRVQELRPLADDAGLSMAAFAVAWVLQNSNVSAAIVGASRPEQLIDNARAADVSLDTQLLAKADDILGQVVERDPAKVESFLERP